MIKVDINAKHAGDLYFESNGLSCAGNVRTLIRFVAFGLTMTKLHLLQNINFLGEIFFATIVNGLSVLKPFQLSNGDLSFFVVCLRIYKERKPRIPKLGHTTL